MRAVNVGNITRRASLCVPGSEPSRILKALHSGADEVVVDLEDAVAVGGKDAARDELARLEWPDERPRVAVRVNAPRTPWCHRDLVAVAGIPEVDSVVVPKVESHGDLAFVDRLLDGAEAGCGRQRRLAVQALLETAGGIAAVGEVVGASPRLAAVVIGYADLAASLGRERPRDPGTWLAVQEQVLLHGRAAGVEVVDGPHLGVQDDDAFAAEVARAAALGFDGKWVIHPRQVARVASAFTPAADRVDHARRVLAALQRAAEEGRGAAVLDDALVDEAMARDARRVLARAAR